MTPSMRFSFIICSADDFWQFQPFRKQKSSFLLIHHSTWCPVTVIEEEIVVGPAGLHEVTNGLPPQEICGFDNLQREKAQSRRVWPTEYVFCNDLHLFLEKHKDLLSRLSSCGQRRSPPCQRRCRSLVLYGWATEFRHWASLWQTNSRLKMLKVFSFFISHLDLSPSVTLRNNSFRCLKCLIFIFHLNLTHNTPIKICQLSVCGLTWLQCGWMVQMRMNWIPLVVSSSRLNKLACCIEPSARNLTGLTTTDQSD